MSLLRLPEPCTEEDDAVWEWVMHPLKVRSAGILFELALEQDRLEAHRVFCWLRRRYRTTASHCYGRAVRWPSVNSTFEDSVIWTGNIRRRGVPWYRCTLLNAAYLRADQRDADLMLQAHEMRAVWRKCNPLVAAFDDTDKIDCGGSLLHLWCDYPHRIPI